MSAETVTLAPIDRPPTLSLVPDLPPVTMAEVKAMEANTILGHVRLYESIYRRRVDFAQPANSPSNVAVMVRRYNTLAAELGLNPSDVA